MAGLLNLGTGLGGFMQGMQQSRDSDLRAQMQRLAMQQAQQKQMAQRLLGMASLSGLGGGIGGGLQGLLTGATGGGQGPQPPAPGAPSVPAAPQSASAAVPPATPETISAPSPTGGGQPEIPIDPTAMQEYNWSPGSRTSGNARSDSNDPRWQAEVRPEPGPAPPTTPTTPAPPTVDPTASDPGGGADAGGGGATAPDRSSLFTQLFDPEHAYTALGSLRDRIAERAPPGTDPAAIWEATQELYKLTSGGAMERAQLAAYLKLSGLDLKEKQGNRSLDLRERGQNLTEAQKKAALGSKEAIAKANEAGRDKRAGATLADRQAGRGARRSLEEMKQKYMDDRKAADRLDRSVREAARSADAATRANLNALGKEIAATIGIINGSQADPDRQDQAAARLKELSEKAARMGVQVKPASRDGGE